MSQMSQTSMPSTIILTSTDPVSGLASYLSGNLADYHLVSSAPGEVIITPINSYKERLRRAKAELREVVEKNNRMEEEREAVRRAQLYSTILSELNEIWFIALPEDVRTALVAFGKINLPNAFASWWIQWEEVSPIKFPLPPSMRYFGPVEETTKARFILDSSQHESDLSRAITRAWEAIPDISRQLMLFCWAGRHSIRTWRDEIAHPNLGKSSAKAILGQDFRGNFQGLHAAASYMADYLFT